MSSQSLHKSLVLVLILTLVHLQRCVADPPIIFCDKLIQDGLITAFVNGQSYNGSETDLVSVRFTTKTFFKNVDLLVLDTNKFSSFPTSLCAYFPNIFTIVLNNNNFASITKKAFRQCKQITQLEIYNENFKSLLDDTFINLPNLDFLILDSLNIHTIQPNAFNGLSMLTELDMYNNNLASVPKQLLATLTSLEIIVMQDNGIQQIPNGFFDNCPEISNIVINERLLGFCKTLFDDLDELHDLDLQGNPCVGETRIFNFDNYIDYSDMLGDILWNTADCVDICLIRIL